MSIGVGVGYRARRIRSVFPPPFAAFWDTFGTQYPEREDGHLRTRGVAVSTWTLLACRGSECHSNQDYSWLRKAIALFPKNNSKMPATAKIAT